MNQIEELRKEIDAVDSEILRQLNKRIELVFKIRDCKRQGKLPVEDITREEDIISNLELDKLDESFVRDIYKTIFDHSKSKQTQ